MRAICHCATGSEHAVTAPTEPAGQGQAVAACRQHFVGNIRRQEHHQRAGLGQYITHLAVRQVKAQLTTVLGLPAVIEVQDGRYRTAVVVAEAIQVLEVEAARRIEGEVALVVDQAQVCLLYTSDAADE